MKYCEVWCGVRKGHHCDIPWREWGPPLPLILSHLNFDECIGWLSTIWCISLICMGDLIGYLTGVNTFVNSFVVVKILELARCWFDWNSAKKSLECPNIFLSTFWSIHWPPRWYINRTSTTGSRYISRTGTQPYKIGLWSPGYQG